MGPGLTGGTHNVEWIYYTYLLWQQKLHQDPQGSNIPFKNQTLCHSLQTCAVAYKNQKNQSGSHPICKIA
jgi:hypothetical protein